MNTESQYSEYWETTILAFKQLPIEWDLSKLGYEAWVRARLGWKGLKADEYVDEGFIFLSTPNIKSRDIDFENVNFITMERYKESPEIQLRVGDVLLAKDGSTLGTVNYIRQLPRPATVNSSLAVITCNNKLDGLYVYYLFQSRPWTDLIGQLKGGMGVPHLFQSDLTKFPLPLPPKLEQEEISKKLDRETARIDALIEKKTLFIELLKEKRQVLITQAVTKGLNPHVVMQDSRVEWIGDAPAHWDVLSLRWCSTIQSGIALGGASKVGIKYELPYLRVANVQDGHLSLDNVKTVEVEKGQIARYALKKGDVLMNEGGDNDKLGRGAVWKGEIEPCLHQNHVFAVRPSPHLLPEWLAYCTQSHTAKAHFRVNAKQSTNLASISSTNIKELKIPLPPLDEQQAICESIVKNLASVDTIIAKTERSIDLLKEHRSALITAAVTGQIDLREDAA
ncbi:restriction endonuclease subunit S [Sedimenticola selenatireducens]|uniref:restriction endonuclease subunit S n=1 Tax=Sedimenticola selenatireducens TaxID=191960 RepID=UPI002AAA9E66|nr:restriction endonuclease subunit S [Sedimenticola selenatireducens]